MFKIFLFFPLFLLATEFFTLPNDASHLNYTIAQDIKKAEKEIYIFTPYLKNYEITKALSKSAKNGINIKIIVANKKDDDSFRLVLLKNISVFILKTKSVKPTGSIVCIDKNNLFLLSDNLDFKSFQKNISFATKTTSTCRNIFSTLLQQSEDY